MVVYVLWYSRVSSVANVWRLLDLSGLTRSVRQSWNYLRAGYVYVDGNLVTSSRATVPIGKSITLELRFPNQSTSKDIMVVSRMYATNPRRGS